MAHLGIEICACTYELCYPGSVILLSSHQKQEIHWSQALCRQQHTRSQEWASVSRQGIFVNDPQRGFDCQHYASPHGLAC